LNSGCIASSDHLEDYRCFCSGAGIGAGGVTLGLNAWVDVSIFGLPFLETAKFLNSVHSQRVLVPADILNKLNRRVHLTIKRKRFGDVLETSRSHQWAAKEKDKAKIMSSPEVNDHGAQMRRFGYMPVG
jgi:hypothetical protein